MTSRDRPPTKPLRSHRLRTSGLLAAVAVVVALLGHPLLTSPFSTAASTVDVLRGEHHDGLGEADGVVPDGVTVLDDDVPAVAKLAPDLLAALRGAARLAADDGVELVVNSGWRSVRYQQQLLDEAISKYGSRQEAARWVATPSTSPHVSGNAVDVGPRAGAVWLSEHGADYGLCQIYANEPWHFELRDDAVDHGCPAMYADPTSDPRTYRRHIENRLHGGNAAKP